MNVFKKIIKVFISPIRRSSNISKQILHLKVRDFLLTNPLKVGLDIGCADMPYKPLFKTERYIGVDFDEPRLKEGLKKYPDAEACASSLFEIPKNITGDLVVCIQTIQINAKFDRERTFEAVNKLILVTNNNGSLIFNIGTSDGKDWRELRNIIFDTLKKSFKKVKVDRIGFYDESVSMNLSLPIAYLIKILPFFHRILTPDCLLFSASKKIR